MAYFAELDEDNIVIHVHVIGDDIPTSNGNLLDNPKHVDGEEYCRTLFKTDHIYKQTTKDRSYGNKYAAKGDLYDADKDAFITSQPFPSWNLNQVDGRWIWQPPKSPPPPNQPSLREYTYTNDDGVEVTGYYDMDWDEDNLRWRAVKNDGSTLYWDNDNNQFVAE